MKQIAQSYKTGQFSIVDLPTPRASAGSVRVDTRVSLISAGTERAAIDIARKSLLGKALQRPDLVRKVVDKVRREGPLAALDVVRGKLDTPVPLGYSLAGVVAEVGRGVDGLRIGQRVACAGAGFANHAEANVVPINMVVPIPDAVTDAEAAFVTMGAIALHGVRLSELALGSTVAIIGLGLLGQLAVQLAAAHGANVIAMDVVPARVQLALQYGARTGVVIGTDDARALSAAHSRGRGVDAVVVTAASKTNEPLVLAGEIARDRGRVVIVGSMPIEVPRKEYYEKELSVVVSRSYGPGRYDPAYEERGQDYPIGYVRWTERRNLEAILDAIAMRQLDVASLTSHRFAFEDVLSAYALVMGETGTPHMGVLLEYPARSTAPQSVVATSAPRPIQGPVGIGVLGTGNFAQAVLLPRLAKLQRDRQVRLVAAASTRGLSASSAARKFTIERLESSLDGLLADPDVQAIVVATRHAAHASQVARILAAGRHVFVEKPLAVDEEQLRDVEKTYAATDGIVMVGFNRRFAPFTLAVKETFASRRAGLVMLARINAGPMPSTSWVFEEGGRIVGEACHFIDLMSAWCGAPVVEASRRGIESGRSSCGGRDNAILSLRFADGSIGTLIYTSMADASLPKELFEIHCEGTSALIDDWRTLRVVREGKTKTTRALRADKGHGNELARFVEACAAGHRGASPIAWEQLVATTRATFTVDEADVERRHE